jgi:hypothetical protein
MITHTRYARRNLIADSSFSKELFLIVRPEFELMSVCVDQKLYDRLSRVDERLSRVTQKKVPFFTK